MHYERMKYAHDQREWVKYADEKLPALREHTSMLQQQAAKAFADWQIINSMWKNPYSFSQRLVSECYASAHYSLLRVIYYEGMRRANLPREEDS